MSSPRLPVRVGALDRRVQSRLRARVLRADVDEPELGADREAGDGHAFEQERRVLLHQVLVDVGARVALVAVHDDELLARVLAREVPLEPGREAGAAAAAQVRRLHLRDADRRAWRRAPRAARSSRPAGSAPARRGRSTTRARAAGCGSPASTRSSAPGPASTTSPSRKDGLEWQKPRQTVSFSATAPSAVPMRHAEPRLELADLLVEARRPARGSGADAHDPLGRRAVRGRRRRSRSP